MRPDPRPSDDRPDPTREERSTPITTTPTPAPADARPYRRRTAVAIEHLPEPLARAEATATLAAIEDRLAAQFAEFLRGEAPTPVPAATDHLAGLVEHAASKHRSAESREQFAALGRRAIARGVANIEADPGSPAG